MAFCNPIWSKQKQMRPLLGDASLTWRYQKLNSELNHGSMLLQTADNTPTWQQNKN